jgi:hypothetical protein
MRANELFRAIENMEFAARTRIASTLGVLLVVIRRQPETKKLIGELRRSISLQSAVLRRLITLVSLEIDHRYQNPLDSALSAYLCCLNEINPSIARIGATIVLRARNTFWAPLVVDEILRNAPTAASNSEEAAFLVRAETRKTLGIDVKATDAGEWECSVLMLPSSASFEVCGSINSRPDSGGAWSQQGMKMNDLFGNRNLGASFSTVQTESDLIPH